MGSLQCASPLTVGERSCASGGRSTTGGVQVDLGGAEQERIHQSLLQPLDLEYDLGISLQVREKAGSSKRR